MSALPPGYEIIGDRALRLDRHAAPRHQLPGSLPPGGDEGRARRLPPSPTARVHDGVHKSGPAEQNDPYPHAERLIAGRRGASWRGLGPEDRVQAEIVRGFDDMIRARTGCVVAMAVPNDSRHPRGRSGIAAALGARLLAMGLLPGASDLVLLWPGRGLGLLEVKVPRRVEQRLDGPRHVLEAGRLGDNQKSFRDLALAWRLPWGLARSWEQALETARDWGALAR